LSWWLENGNAKGNIPEKEEITQEKETGKKS
jgi:hypothetical protein